MIRRLLIALLLPAVGAMAAPPLTTIQDLLYKADGTRFNGTLTIAWNSFQAPDNSSIVMQTITVKVIDGNLRVQLVPTTASAPAASYSVTYNSDGRVQFQETWQVPTSGTPLHVRDVRVAVATTTTSTAGGSTAAADTTTPVTEADVVGLIADLGARPLKGPAFAAGRTAMVDATGMLAAVTGNASDCVHVDGSTGPCGDSDPGFVDGDSPSGIVDGSNVSFGLSAAPDPATSLALYRNGVLQKVGQDYTLTGSTVQFVAASTPQPADTLLASYRSSTDSSTAQPYTAAQVLCSGTGAATSATSLTSIGNCTISAGLLAAGDRLEIRFDLAHPGTASGFTFQMVWGATTVVNRVAGAADALVAGRADVAILASGAQWNSQTWGSVLPFAAGVGSASDSYANGISIAFLGMVAQAGDSVNLANFTVVRVP